MTKIHSYYLHVTSNYTLIIYTQVADQRRAITNKFSSSALLNGDWLIIIRFLGSLSVI